MPFPAGATTITVTGNFPIPAGGDAATGSVVFTPSTTLVDGTQHAIYSGAGTATLNSSGTISKTLLCTDDTDVQPAGWRWRVDEQIPGGRRTYWIDLPSTLGPTVDLSTLAPVSGPGGSGSSLPPTGPAGGALTGSYPNPQLSEATIASFDADAATKYVPILAGQRFLTATGDPAADATAINAAILAVSQAGGGRVLLSGQAWTISSSITPRSNVTLAGSPGTVIRHTATSNIVYGNSVAFTNFTLEDITFQGTVNEFPTSPKRARTTSGPGAQTAVFLTGDLDTTGSGQAQLRNFTMRRCTVENMSALPIRIGGVRGKVSVTDCNFLYCQDAGFIFCESVDFSHNYVYGGADNGVSLSRGCQKITCVGNRIENCAYDGIWLSGFVTDKGPSHFAVTGNVIRNVGHNGINIDYAAKYGSVSDNTIDCGYFRGPSDEPTDIRGAGIYIGGYPIDNRPAHRLVYAYANLLQLKHPRKAAAWFTAMVYFSPMDNMGARFLAPGGPSSSLPFGI